MIVYRVHHQIYQMVHFPPSQKSITLSAQKNALVKNHANFSKKNKKNRPPGQANKPVSFLGHLPKMGVVLLMVRSEIRPATVTTWDVFQTRCK